jgi:hypothetical protein
VRALTNAARSPRHPRAPAHPTPIVPRHPCARLQRVEGSLQAPSSLQHPRPGVIHGTQQPPPTVRPLPRGAQAPGTDASTVAQRLPGASNRRVAHLPRLPGASDCGIARDPEAPRCLDPTLIPVPRGSQLPRSAPRLVSRGSQEPQRRPAFLRRSAPASSPRTKSSPVHLSPQPPRKVTDRAVARCESETRRASPQTKRTTRTVTSWKRH